MLYLKDKEVVMSELKKKKSLATLHGDIKAIRQHKPSQAQIEELNKVLEKEVQNDKRRIARSLELQS
jgi:hypothetical protein